MFVYVYHVLVNVPSVKFKELFDPITTEAELELTDSYSFFLVV